MVYNITSHPLHSQRFITLRRKKHLPCNFWNLSQETLNMDLKIKKKTHINNLESQSTKHNFISLCLWTNISYINSLPSQLLETTCVQWTEVTLKAACSIHEPFLLNLEKFSHKSSYLNHDHCYWSVCEKKYKLCAVINRFFIKLAVINIKSILRTQFVILYTLSAIVAVF